MNKRDHGRLSDPGGGFRAEQQPEPYDYYSTARRLDALAMHPIAPRITAGGYYRENPLTALDRAKEKRHENFNSYAS